MAARIHIINHQSMANYKAKVTHLNDHSLHYLTFYPRWHQSNRAVIKHEHFLLCYDIMSNLSMMMSPTWRVYNQFLCLSAQ